MAVPKRKTSKARRDKRKANWKLTFPNLVKCEICGKFVKSHTVCRECGCFKGNEVI